MLKEKSSGCYDKGIFDLGDIEKTGYISCFHLERDVKCFPNNRKNRKLKSILLNIEQEHNHSWYCEMIKRSGEVSNMPALFYRGSKITFQEMMETADKVAGSLKCAGVKPGSEVAVCMANVPELVYVMLGINKLGAKMNSFSASYNPEFIEQILKDCDSSVMLVTDDSFERARDLFLNSEHKSIVVTSRTRSLPSEPEKCDEYVPELDRYYRIEDLSTGFADEHRVVSFDRFLDQNQLSGEVKDSAVLDTEFLITYTSGSTKIGFPKAIVHTNRSLIVSGRFHDAEVSGNPDLKGLRSLAMIHSDSNTCLITCISDILMQGWCVALEPEYCVENALDYLILNKPNYASMTCSFWDEAARQYLVEKRFSDMKLGFLLAAFAVGEGLGSGEELFLNRFLKQSKAGSAVGIKGFHLPYAPVSIGGGDCEHGGIYYTLWRSFFSKIHFVKLRGKPIGMLPEKYVVVTTLKEEAGRWIECKRNEIGVVVANSATTMKCYKNNPLETKKKIITDKKGRDWVSCNVLGYIDSVGAVHVKGRIEELRRYGSEVFYPYMADEVIERDKKNILFSTTVFHKNNNAIVASVLLNPLSSVNEMLIINNAMKRCREKLPQQVVDVLRIKVFHDILDFPITESGKRNIRALEMTNL